MKLMVDATHANLPGVPLAGYKMAAGYTTGTFDIRWTAADWQRCITQGLEVVKINQGYHSPVEITENVIDVENGAWSPSHVPFLITNMRQNGVARPTVYCSLNTVPLIWNTGYRHGDVWIAAYIPNIPQDISYLFHREPLLTNYNVVAWQWADLGSYDSSVVFDTSWPGEPIPPAPKVKGKKVLILRVTASDGAQTTYLYNGTDPATHIVSPKDEAAFVAAGLPVVDITEQQLNEIGFR